MSKKAYDHLVKIMLIGDSSVGKSSIILRYTDHEYVGTFIPTIGVDFKIKTLNFNGQTIKLQIWDTAGQERFNSITFSYYRGAAGVVLVYDITNCKSFENLSTWIRNIEENASENVFRLIIGNKCDREDLRVIPTHKAKELAEKFGIDFMETSAKENINIDNAFISITKRILEAKLNDIPDNRSQSQSNQSYINMISTAAASLNNQRPNCC